MKHKRAKEVTQEQLFQQIENFKSFLYFHGYQPPRRLKIRDQVLYDITGEHEVEGGYNERVWDRCYHPMTVPIAQEDLMVPDAILSSPLVAEHLFGITRDWIKKYHPHAWLYVKEVLADEVIPIVDPYLHQILPLLPDQAQSIMIDIGIKAWEQDMDTKLVDDKGRPLKGFGFWPPELSVNNRTVEILAQKGVRFLFLDQAQIKSDNYAPIYELKTKHGSVYVFAYNGSEFAQKLAFEQIIDSSAFAEKVYAYIGRNHVPPFAAMDMETFGEWRGMDSIYFLNHLVHQGLNPDDFSRNRDMIQPAELVEPSSWSCDCGFGRWDGTQACAGESQELQKRKQDLYQGLRTKLDETLNQLNENHKDWETTFVNFFINSRNQLGGGDNVDFTGLSEPLQQPFERLYVNLVGLTSCGWFYTDSELERNIPMSALKWLG